MCITVESARVRVSASIPEVLLLCATAPGVGKITKDIVAVIVLQPAVELHVVGCIVWVVCR